MIILSNRMPVHSPLPSVIHIRDADVPFISSVKNLGVTLDLNLSMSQHISNTCKAPYIQIKHISSIWHFLTTQAESVALEILFIIIIKTSQVQKDIRITHLNHWPKNLINKYIHYKSNVLATFSWLEPVLTPAFDMCKSRQSPRPYSLSHALCKSKKIFSLSCDDVPSN